MRPVVSLRDETLNHEEARLAEQRKYLETYQSPRYRMKNERKADAAKAVRDLPTTRGGFLDVGCGRGEMLVIADTIGFDRVAGVEIVPDLIGGRVVRGEVHALPFDDDEFDVVTMFDVIEHLLRGDDEAACRELARVARSHVVLTANNHPSVHRGVDLHINIRSYDQWDALFRDWFSPGSVTRLGQTHYISEAWRIDL